MTRHKGRRALGRYWAACINALIGHWLTSIEWKEVIFCKDTLLSIPRNHLPVPSHGELQRKDTNEESRTDQVQTRQYHYFSEFRKFEGRYPTSWEATQTMCGGMMSQGRTKLNLLQIRHKQGNQFAILCSLPLTIIMIDTSVIITWDHPILVTQVIVCYIQRSAQAG